MTRSLDTRLSLLLIPWMAGCGGAEALQVVVGNLELALLEEEALVVQARDEQGELRAASPTDRHGEFVLFVPAATLHLTASGRRVHDLGTLRICAVGAPIEMQVAPATMGFTEACLDARRALSDCRRTTEPTCSDLESEVQACRAGDPIEACIDERKALGDCEAEGRDCVDAQHAWERCRLMVCTNRFNALVDGGCLEGCQPYEDDVISECTEPRNQPAATEVGCTPSP